MSTKADMQSNINTKLADSSDITAQEHREVLSDDAASILENIYGDKVDDTEASTNIVTVNGDFTYNVEINKVGSLVTIIGTINATATKSAPGFVFNITDPEYQPSRSSYTLGYNPNTGETFMMRLSSTSNTLLIDSDLFNGDSIRFSITYRVTA